MKILLTNIPGPRVKSGKGAPLGLDIDAYGVFPPIGILYLAAALRRQGRHEACLVDCAPKRLTAEDVVEIVRREAPDVVGMTTFTPNFYDALYLTRALRRAFPALVIVWGGPHVMCFAEESMTHPEVDYLLQGECEETLPRFLDALEDGAGLDAIPGVLFRRDGVTVSTGQAPFIEDIDSLAFPTWDILDQQDYHTAIGGGLPTAVICSSRGCPFKCTYCSHPYTSHRRRSIANVLEEMENHYANGVREFFFFDDLFNITSKRVKELSQAVLDRGLDIAWSFRGRVDAVDEEMCALARKAGCRQILFGIEDATDEGLRIINKKITMAQVRNALTLARRHGITTSSNWIIGLPRHKKRQDVLDLLHTAIDLDPDFAQFNILVAYHGTEIFRDGAALGMYSPDIWRDYVRSPSPDFVAPIWDRHMSRGELSELMALCFKRFYFRPRPILRKIMSLRSPTQFWLYVRGFFSLLALGGRGGGQPGKEKE